MAGKGGVDLEYSYKTKPSNLVNSLFMSTVNTAARTLVSVASNIKSDHYTEKWRPSDHLQFMVMLMTWVTVWVLRVLMDHFPTSMIPSSTRHLLGGVLSGGRSSGYLALPAPASSSTMTMTSATTTLATSGVSSWELMLQDDVDGPTVQALGRALTHILALLNEIPATSRKYQFAMTMAERVMDGNFRCGHVDLENVNRVALSSAFDRTSTLLYRSMRQPHQPNDDWHAWPTRMIKLLPLGSYIASYVNGMNYCFSTVMQVVKGGGAWQLENKRRGGREWMEDITAEKMAEELLWITNKLRTYGAVDEALVQWSFASGLASLALNSNPRVQGLIVKISALLMGDLSKDNVDVSDDVKFRLVVLWLPLFCHANNGLSYPVLTTFEKIEVERAIDTVVSTLPPVDQEVILTNWLQDFSVTSSEWPNLQLAYDRWCQTTRELVI